MNTVSRLTFETRSGSTYEVDQREKKIRWLSGKRRDDAFPPAGQWRTFEDITFIEVGKSVVITFPEYWQPIITTEVASIQGQRAA